MQKYWFKAKRYGWGWYPATKEGWAVLVGFLVTIFLTAFIIASLTTNEDVFTLALVGTTLIETMIFLFITWKTGEKPGWRWGDKK